MKEITYEVCFLTTIPGFDSVASRLDHKMLLINTVFEVIIRTFGFPVQKAL